MQYYTYTVIAKIYWYKENVPSILSIDSSKSFGIPKYIYHGKSTIKKS